MQEKKQNQGISSDTSKAITVAASWASGWRLKVEVPPSSRGVDLIVNGLEVRVCDGIRCESEVAGKACGRGGAIVLQADNLNSRSAEVAVKEMWKLTTVAGIGEPKAFRASAAGLRASSEDYEATSMRLTPFQRTANPQPAQLRQFEPIVKREASRAGKRYQRILEQMSMDEGDLHTVGLVFLCNYLHRYQDLHDENRNGANLTLSLQQEFRRWASVTCDKLKGISFCAAGVPVAEVVGSPIAGVQFMEQQAGAEAHYLPVETLQPAKAEAPEPVFGSERERKQHEKRLVQEDNRYIKARQAAKAQLLEDLLSGMGHDEYVAALEAVIVEERHPIEAREEAERRMKKHIDICVSCSDKVKRVAEEKKKNASSLKRRRWPYHAKIHTIDDRMEAQA